MKPNLKEMMLIGIFAALTAILAQISVPIPFSPVPITLQILTVCLAGVILGSKCGAYSQVIYVLIGVLGIPVFAKGGAGPSVIAGFNGGYIISFPIIAFIIGYLLERKKNASRIDMAVAMIIGVIICYVFGATWIATVHKYGFAKAIAVGVAPFLPLDLLKVVLGTFIGYEVRSALIRSKLLKL